jgi:N-acetylneuraminic acid mutarotase
MKALSGSLNIHTLHTLNPLMKNTSFILTLFFCVTFAGGAAAQVGGTWQTLAPMPTARQELATAALNGKIYAMGGYDNSGTPTNIVEVYDPATDTWTSAHPIPRALHHNSAAVAAGKLYSFGGPSMQAFVYDEVNDSWSAVASMLFFHALTPAVGVFNDKIYVAGGANGGGGNSMQNQVEVYDPVTNTWTALQPMRDGRNHCGGAFIGGKFYVVGGRRRVHAVDSNEVYDPQTNKWERRAPLPTARGGIGVAAVSGELFVFGGETLFPNGGGVVHGEVEVFNPATNTWRSLSPMPIPRHGIWASVIGNNIFLPGGGSVSGFGATNVNTVFTVTP